MQSIPVTVVVPIKNEEKTLAKCLDLLKEFDEVIVVDSGSTDKSPQIVEQYGRTYANFIWDGKFPKKRNWTLRNVKMRNDWVLFLDADEFLTDEFKSEISIKIKNTDCVGFWISYTNEFMGKLMKHGAPMRKLAFMKIGSGEYEYIDENHWSNLDMEVHEHLVLNGKVGFIKSRIIHRDFRGLTHYIQKHNEYSSWEANHFIDKKGNTDRTGEVSFQQKVKYTLIDSWLLAPMYFIYCYFIKGGFMEGKEGFMWAAYKMQYFYNVKAKIEEIRKGLK